MLDSVINVGQDTRLKRLVRREGGKGMGNWDMCSDIRKGITSL